MENQLVVKEKGFTPNVLKAMVLETTKDIYTHLSINNMSVTNLNMGSGGESQKDPAGQLIAQVAASYKAISGSM